MVHLKKFFIIPSFFIFFSSFTLTANPKRPWTFLTYIAADNNLYAEADKNIAQMVQASITTNAYIIVYLNIKRPDQAKVTQRLIIQDGTIKQYDANTVEDSGDAATLLKAMVWAVMQFPSEYLVVDIWNHGSGSLNRRMIQHRGVCYDDTTGNFMTDHDYKRAFEVLVQEYRAGKKVDIIAFDACLMADLEVAYTLQPYAHYLVSSQETVPGTGFNYTSTLSPLSSGVPTPYSFSRWIVNAYGKHYLNSGLSYTMSALDLNKLDNVVAATNTIAILLNQFLLLDKKNSPIIDNVIRNIPHFDEPTYGDLYMFYIDLLKNSKKMHLSSLHTTALETALRNGINAISKVIIANTNSAQLSQAHGISAYFAQPALGIEPSYYDLYWTTQNPAWINFLKRYIEAQ